MHSPLHHKILTTKVSHTFRPPPLILTLSLSLALRWLWHFFPLAHIVVVYFLGFLSARAHQTLCVKGVLSVRNIKYIDRRRAADATFYLWRGEWNSAAAAL